MRLPSDTGLSELLERVAGIVPFHPPGAIPNRTQWVLYNSGLLRRLRSGVDARDEWLISVLQSINGIAAEFEIWADRFRMGKTQGKPTAAIGGWCVLGDDHLKIGLVVTRPHGA
jgi:hypothetical protein